MVEEVVKVVVVVIVLVLCMKEDLCFLLSLLHYILDMILMVRFLGPCMFLSDALTFSPIVLLVILK